MTRTCNLCDFKPRKPLIVTSRQYALQMIGAQVGCHSCLDDSTIPSINANLCMVASLLMVLTWSSKKANSPHPSMAFSPQGTSARSNSAHSCSPGAWVNLLAPYKVQAMNTKIYKYTMHSMHLSNCWALRFDALNDLWNLWLKPLAKWVVKPPWPRHWWYQDYWMFIDLHVLRACMKCIISAG